MPLSLDDLTKRASATRSKAIARLKQHYDLARQLGFSAEEAVVLQSHKRDTIITLAIERGYIKSENDQHKE